MWSGWFNSLSIISIWSNDLVLVDHYRRYLGANEVFRRADVTVAMWHLGVVVLYVVSCSLMWQISVCRGMWTEPLTSSNPPSWERNMSCPPHYTFKWKIINQCKYPLFISYTDVGLNVCIMGQLEINATSYLFWVWWCRRLQVDRWCLHGLWELWKSLQVSPNPNLSFYSWTLCNYPLSSEKKYNFYFYKSLLLLYLTCSLYDFYFNSQLCCILRLLFVPHFCSCASSTDAILEEEERLLCAEALR